MSMETCTEHDYVVVVYDGHGYQRSPCPLCDAVQTAKDLVEAIEELQTERDGLKGDIKEDHATISDLNSTIDDLESQIAALERNGVE